MRLLVPIGPPLGGKTTLCKHAGPFVVASFAEPLYRMVGEMLGDYDLVAGMRDRNEKAVPIPQAGGKTLRYLLQTLGTDWGRDMVDEGVWCDRLFRKWGAEPYLAIDDLRFQNEYDTAVAKGALIVRVQPHAALRTEGWTHKSESFWDTFPAHCSVPWNTRDELIAQAQAIGERWDELVARPLLRTNPTPV